MRPRKNHRVLSIKLDSGIYDRLDAYWHEQRLPNRTAALEQLLEEALRVHESQRPPMVQLALALAPNRRRSA